MRKFISIRYINLIKLWIWRGKFYILSALTICISFLYISEVVNFYPNHLAFGMTIIGLGIILQQQSRDVKDFSSHEPNTLVNWLRSFPKTKNVTIHASSASASLGMFGSPTIYISMPDNATIEQKVEHLYNEISGVKNSIGNINMHIESVESLLSERIQGLALKLQKIDASINGLLASHVIGNYDLNFFGIIITLCGATFQFFLEN